VNAAGACAGALGAIDILIGVAMLVGASSYDAALETAATAAAMRSYGVRSALAGAVCLAFVWAVFAEPGARALWFLLPLAVAVADLVFDVAALSSGAIPAMTVSVTAALHEVLAMAVAAVALAGWRREVSARASARVA
jgi:hypothetical protein